MATETARTLLLVILVLGFACWLAGALYLRAVRRDPLGLGPEALERTGERGGLAREFELAVPLDELLERATRALADTTAVGSRGGMSGPARIVSRARDQLVFTHRALGIEEGRIRLTRLGPERTRARLEVRLGAIRHLLTAGLWVSGASLLALVLGYLLLDARVAAAEDAALRMQSWQLVQSVHLLWPPFLFAALYRYRTRFALEHVETLLRNQEFVRRPAATGG